MKIVLDILVLVVACVAGFLVVAASGKKSENAEYSFSAAGLCGGVLTAIVLITVGWLTVGSFGIIPAGDVGVTLQWGKPTNELKDNGWYFAPAFLGYSVYPMQSTSIREKTVQNASASTYDLQAVSTDITMNFHLTQVPSSILNVYTNLRGSFDDVIGPLTLESLKAVTAHYTAQDLIDKRAMVKDELDTLLRSRLGKYGVTVDNVSLTQFQFSDEFNNAIEAKVTQEQAALQAKARLAQVYWEARATVTKAQADARAFALRRASLTPTLVQQNFVDKWDGKLPTVMGSGSLTSIPQSVFSGANQ